MTPELGDTIDLLRDLVAYPTVSSDSNLALIADLAQRLEDCGAKVETFGDDTGRKANLFASIGPEQADGGVVLSGHTDVVPVDGQDWASDPFQLTERGGRLYGRGTCDMKGFVSACVVMARQYRNLPLRRPLHFAFTYDEEVGCLGARALIPQLQARGLRPGIAIIGEPTSMRVIEGHKGCCEYTVRFSGLEGHGSAPDRGVNAIEYAVRYASRLLELRDRLSARTPAGSRFDPPWTTINLGALHGGVAHNVIAGQAELEWEMRPVTGADQDFVKQEMQSYVERELLPGMQSVHPGASVRTRTVGEVPGLEPMAQNAARDLVNALTGSNERPGVVSFGTEAGLFQALGTSVVVCGPGSIEQAHKADEFVSLDQMQKCLILLGALGQNLTVAPSVPGAG